MTNDTAHDEEIEVYEFVTAGKNTCERCMALAGSQWHEPPNPPHDHCECEVQIKIMGTHWRQQRDCTENDVTIQSLPNGTVNYGPADDFGFEWGFWVEIDCWDGLIHGFEIWVDMGKNSDYPNTDDVFEVMEAFAWSELQDEIDAVMSRVCRLCPDLVVS
jgi:hypothetical protein